MEEKEPMDASSHFLQEQMSDDQKGIECTALDMVGDSHEFCAICLERIPLQETALVKGCEHAYCIHDYMFEESVCLLIRATWFVPLPLEAQEEASYEQEAIYQYEDEEDDDLDDEAYFGSSSSLRIGNRRWGDNGYIRAGRREARPVHQERFQEASAGSSGGQRNKEPSKDVMGRRAKRAMKRDAADKAAAAKHQQHLQRLGRK
ncbi:uncharacterized protein LOC131251242 isoform X4 [Magnolia sinica]|uniref:uncharacterized protein LOC131251242 isoform X4 n=1 Tax=Magnolia sinica TaxID=86752 RepID=UPI00265A3FE5|nr:uncharacterized protein LOC131251242 isoform X4 [Magnolia sinica]